MIKCIRYLYIIKICNKLKNDNIRDNIFRGELMRKEYNNKEVYKF